MKRQTLQVLIDLAPLPTRPDGWLRDLRQKRLQDWTTHKKKKTTERTKKSSKGLSVLGLLTPEQRKLAGF